ncbi:hypothetical protein D3C72_2112180 [compost metagenome]
MIAHKQDSFARLHSNCEFACNGSCGLINDDPIVLVITDTYVTLSDTNTCPGDKLTRTRKELIVVNLISFQYIQHVSGELGQGSSP